MFYANSINKVYGSLNKFLGSSKFLLIFNHLQYIYITASQHPSKPMLASPTAKKVQINSADNQ